MGCNTTEAEFAQPRRAPLVAEGETTLNMATLCVAMTSQWGLGRFSLAVCVFCLSCCCFGDVGVGLEMATFELLLATEILNKKHFICQKISFHREMYFNGAVIIYRSP